MWIFSSISTMPPGTPMLRFDCPRAMWTARATGRSPARKARRPLPRLLDRDDDDSADRRGLALRPAEHLDALNPPRAGIVGDVEIGLHLDHAAPPASSPAALRDARRRRGGASGAVSAATRRLPRPGAASAGPSMTIQDLRFEIGRVSSILTASPAR